MKIKFFKIALISVLILSGFSPLFSARANASAYGGCPSGTVSAAGGLCLPPSSSNPIPNGPKTFSDLIIRVIAYALGIAFLIAVAMVVYGGILYLTAGDSKRNEQAKKILLNAIIGIVIIVLAYTIVSIINNTLGCVFNSAGILSAGCG